MYAETLKLNKIEKAIQAHLLQKFYHKIFYEILEKTCTCIFQWPTKY